ncbi:hypothetical protein [Methylorubrum aminovorans]
MTAPSHVLEDDGAGGFLVRVGGEPASTVSPDTARPGLWISRDQHGSPMGRHHGREDRAEFLAT